jgi:amino acid adenylation domain-containing protein
MRFSGRRSDERRLRTDQIIRKTQKRGDARMADIQGRIAALSPKRRQVLQMLLAAEQRKSAAIPAIDRNAGVPLSFAQQRLWFIDQLGQQSAAYNICSAWRLTGSLDLAAMQATLQEVARRHEALRTRFVRRDGCDLQIVDAVGQLPIEITDLRMAPEQEREAKVRDIAAAEARTVFNLSTGPLWRIRVLALAGEENVILLAMHHIVSDGWSMSVFLQEVGAIYGAFVKGQSSPLPKLSIQYGDYAAWQRATLQEEALEGQIEYWRERLKNAPLLDLPLDHTRPPKLSPAGAAVPIVVPEDVGASLRELCRSEEATLFMALMAALQIMLSRYSAQQDIVVGTDVANRNRVELEPLIGFFVNQLTIRADLGDDPTGRELLERVRETSLAAYANQDAPFERVVERLNPMRYLNREPIFQVKLLLQNYSDFLNPFPNVQFREFEEIVSRVGFDLVFSLRESAGKITGKCIFATDLFEEQTARTMVRHWGMLLKELATAPDKRISQLAMLGEAELRQIIYDWNALRQQVCEVCAHHLFEEQARIIPSALAVACDDEHLTYAELEKRANQLAHYLRERGVAMETRVAVNLPRSVESIIAMLAIAKAGAVYVPLDPEHFAERRQLVLEDSRAEALVGDGGPVTWHSAFVKTEIDLKRDGQQIGKMSERAPERFVYPDNAAYVMYSSGSTGRPKGALVSHRSLVNLIKWHASTYRTDAGQRTSQFSTNAFGTAIWEIWPTLTHGASLHIVPGEARLSISRLGEWMTANRIVIAFLPALVAMAVMTDMRPGVSLKALLTGSDRLQALGAQDVGFSVVNHYGATEATIVSTWTEVNSDDNPMPIGRPIHNTQAYVLDAVLNPCAIGVPGELFIGGAALAHGYLNRPDMTAERFIPNPYGAGERIFRTGDRVKWRADGRLEYLGRVGEQLKIRGCRVEPGEVESALREHPAVREAVIGACGDKHGQKQIVAYVVPRHEEIPVADLRSHVSAKLPDYMVPAVFVPMYELPLSANGRLDRRFLPDVEELSDLSQEYVAPRTPVEETIAGILRELLRLERVSVTANFFDLGGHSLLAMLVVSRIQEAFAVDTRLSQMFESPTVEQLAAVVEEALTEQIGRMSEAEAERLLLDAAASE